jgi:SAM-dependent methyltransferase
MSEAFHLRIEGVCPICERQTVYEADGPYLRNTLTCTTCPGGSVPRERAVALVLNETRPNWRKLAIHECSPAPRGISVKLQQQGAKYVATNFFPDKPPGSTVQNHRNENLERQTFADASFDLVITVDVFEHLFDPAAAIREIYRTLKPGGVCISAFPMVKGQAAAARWRARRGDNGEIEYIEPAQYHGNPIDPQGSLVTVDYGYDVHQLFAEWAPLNVRVLRFADRSAGVLGEFTDVLVCAK